MAGANPVPQGPINVSSDELSQIKLKDCIRGVIDRLYEQVRFKLSASDVKKITAVIKHRKVWSNFGLTESELKNIKTVKKLTRLLRDDVRLELEGGRRNNLSSSLYNLRLLMEEIKRPDIQLLIANAEQELLPLGFVPLGGPTTTTTTTTSVSFDMMKFLPGLIGVPTEITDPEAIEAYKKALEEGSKSVQRTRLMLVGQERVGKTSLMRNLTYQSFNREEPSTEGINTESLCTIDVTHAKGWILHGERDDPASLKSEFVESVAKEWDQNMQSNAAEKFNKEIQGIMQVLNEAVSLQTDVSSEDAVSPEDAESSETDVSPEDAVSPEHAVSSQNAESSQRVSSENAVSPKDELEPAIAEGPGSAREFTSNPIDPKIANALRALREKNLLGCSQDEGVLLSIWDFAGQDLYYTTHQTFLSSRAVYVVVFNLSQDLEKPIPVPGAGATSCQMTPIQYLDFWMRSVYTYTKENTSKTRNRLEQKSPPIFIVGTHRDSVGGADLPDSERKKLINEIFTRIRKEIHNKAYSRYIVADFFAIENSLGPSNKKIGQLREHINEIVWKEPYMGEKIPLHWLQFDKNTLKEVSKCIGHDGTPVLNLEEVRENSGVKSDVELQTMLTFYHDLGHVVYFGGDGDHTKQELKDVVILDPQWLIDAFKKVITVVPPREQMSGLTKSWQRLQEEGILNDELIDHMWKKFPQKKKPLLCLMDKFDLLCERINQDNNSVSYYVPSMLQKRTPSTNSKAQPQKGPKTSANHFVVDFESFLPDGLFHRLVVRALRWSQTLGGTHPALEYYRGSFFVDVQHEFVLQMERKNDLAYIQVSVILAPEHGSTKRRKKEEKIKRRKTPSPEVTQKVLEFVKNELQNLKDLWIKRISYSLAVACTCGRGSIHFLPLDDCLVKTSISCRIEKRPQVEISTSQFKAMFEQDISAAQDLDDTVDRGPMSDIHLDLIADEVGVEWERLARHLGFRQNDVHKFKANSKGDFHGQKFSMLIAWRQKQQKGVARMTEVLVKALKEVGRDALALKVENYTGGRGDTQSD